MHVEDVVMLTNVSHLAKLQRVKLCAGKGIEYVVKQCKLSAQPLPFVLPSLIVTC